MDLWEIDATAPESQCHWCEAIATRETIEGDLACEWHDHLQSYPVAWCAEAPRPMTEAERAASMDALRKWMFPTQAPSTIYGVRRS